MGFRLALLHGIFLVVCVVSFVTTSSLPCGNRCRLLGWCDVVRLLKCLVAVFPPPLFNPAAAAAAAPWCCSDDNDDRVALHRDLISGNRRAPNVVADTLAEASKNEGNWILWDQS